MNNMSDYLIAKYYFHQFTVTGLEDGGEYEYFIRCEDDFGNINPEDFKLRFFIAGGDNETLPDIPSLSGNITITGPFDLAWVQGNPQGVDHWALEIDDSAYLGILTKYRKFFFPSPEYANYSLRNTSIRIAGLPYGSYRARVMAVSGSGYGSNFSEMITVDSCITWADKPPCNGEVSSIELGGHINEWYRCSDCVYDLFQTLVAFFGS
jgi:hypothetical protein